MQSSLRQWRNGDWILENQASWAIVWLIRKAIGSFRSCWRAESERAFVGSEVAAWKDMAKNHRVGRQSANGEDVFWVSRRVFPLKFSGAAPIAHVHRSRGRSRCRHLSSPHPHEVGVHYGNTCY